MDPDRRLVRFAKSGNRAAFGNLVSKYRAPVLALAFDYLHDYELAADVAQEAFIKAFRHIHEFKENALFSTWLYRITVNAALDARKSLKKQKSGRGLFKKKQTAQPAEEQVSSFLNLDDDMLRALNHLSENQYTAIYEYWQDCGLKERIEWCKDSGESIFSARKEDCIPPLVFDELTGIESFLFG